MREVKKWNKDYRTGEVVEKTVFKEGEALQGRATIQIIDKDGNVVNETFTENIIHTNFSDREYYRQLFASTVGWASQTVGGGASYNYYQQFQTILLSTDDEEESENKIGHWGEVVGYCPRTDTNAGSNKLRGVYNSNESWSKVTEDGYMQYHLVYDFGTSQGNGTFNSVWWVPTLPGYHNSNLYYPFFLKGVKNTRATTISESWIVRDRLGNFYKTDSNFSNFYRITNFEKYINGIEPLKKSSESESFIRAYRWVGSSGEYLDISNKTHTTGNNWGCTVTLTHKGVSGEDISSLVITDIETIVPDLRTYMDKSSSSDRYFRFLDYYYVATNGDVLLNFYGYDDYNKIFPSYSNGAVDKVSLSYNCYLGGVYNIYTKKWKVTPSFTPESMSLGAYYYKNRGDFFNLTDRFDFEGRHLNLSQNSSVYPMFEYDEITNKIVIIGGGDLGVNSNDYYILLSCYIPQLQAFYPTYPTNSSYWFNNALAFIQPPSAHTKLPNPVTKTNADTMKVQYDYLVQIPNIFNFDGDYLKMPE